MGEKQIQNTNELTPAISDSTDFIDLREPVGLSWYESEYGEDAELFGNNIALGLVVAVGELNTTLTLGPDFDSKIHSQPVMHFLSDIITKLITDEERPAAYTSLFNFFYQYMGYSTPEPLVAQLSGFMDEIAWYEAHGANLTHDERLGFSERGDWQDNIFTLKRMAEIRLDEGLSRTDMTYQGSSMDGWDEELFAEFVDPFASENTDNSDTFQGTSGLSWQVRKHLIFEAQHRHRQRAALPPIPRESAFTT